MRTTPLPPSTAPRPDLADADLAGQHLLQHGVDELRLDLDPIVVTDEAVVLGDRLDDRRAGGLYVEVLQAQVVARERPGSGP